MIATVFAVAASSNRRPRTDAPELFEKIGFALFDPGDPAPLDLASPEGPTTMHAATYPTGLVDSFNRRNPFY